MAAHVAGRTNTNPLPRPSVSGSTSVQRHQPPPHFHRRNIFTSLQTALGPLVTTFHFIKGYASYACYYTVALIDTSGLLVFPIRKLIGRNTGQWNFITHLSRETNFHATNTEVSTMRSVRRYWIPVFYVRKRCGWTQSTLPWPLRPLRLKEVFLCANGSPRASYK